MLTGKWGNLKKVLFSECLFILFWGACKISNSYDMPLLGPPSTLAEIFRRTCLHSHFSEISPFSSQNRVILGGRGGPPNNFFIGILLFLLLRSPCKNVEPYDNPLLGFSNGGKKRKKKKRKIYKKFPLAPMGVLAPRSAHARPSARPPIDTSGNFPPPVSAEWPSAFKTVKIFEGVGGVPEIFFFIEI